MFESVTKSGTRYLAAGVLSLGKAAALWGNDRRVRRELTDAGLFIGAGLLFRWLRGGESPKKRLRERLPGGEPSVADRARRQLRSGKESDRRAQARALRERARRKLSREPEPETLLEELRWRLQGRI